MAAKEKDILVQLCLSNGWIKVDPNTGEIYGNRGPGGNTLQRYKGLKGVVINGYIVHTLNANGIKKHVRAHRIVWMAVNGEIPDGYVVDHINNNKTDNRITNLQLLTPERNSTKAKQDGRYLSGDKSPSAKVKVKERMEIHSLYWNSELTQKEIGEMYGISDSRVQQIVHDHRYSRKEEENGKPVP